MIDAERIRRQADLYSVVSGDTPLKNVGPNWWHGPCPVCGGKDRFTLKHDTDGWKFHCRKCHPVYSYAIDYIIWSRPGTSFREACEFFEKSPVYLEKRSYDPPEATKKLEPNTADGWQETVSKAISQCENNLWIGSSIASRALGYLRGRGLTDQTIKERRLGLSPGYFVNKIYVSSGITIPSFGMDGSAWYVKIRLFEGAGKFKCQNKACNKWLEKPGICEACGTKNKYRAIHGGRAGMYNAVSLKGKKYALLVEGEFDAMLASQELAGTGIGVITVGSMSGNINLDTYGGLLLPIVRMIAAYDSDGSSAEGINRIKLKYHFCRAVDIPRVREGDKDLTDYHQAGGDLRSWLLAEFVAAGMPLEELAERGRLVEVLEKTALTFPPEARRAREMGDNARGENLTCCFTHFYQLIESI